MFTANADSKIAKHEAAYCAALEQRLGNMGFSAAECTQASAALMAENAVPDQTAPSALGMIWGAFKEMLASKRKAAAVEAAPAMVGDLEGETL